ncbi:MAG: glycosyltransferase family 4 protein [Segetibacter sp.]
MCDSQKLYAAACRVIATDVGGIPEVITAHNGILVTSENELQLLQAMIEMIENYKAYDKIQISKMAKEKYNYKTIGKDYC